MSILNFPIERGGPGRSDAPAVCIDEAPMMDLAAAESMIRDPESTPSQVLEAAHALQFSPDPLQRIMGREAMAGYCVVSVGELVSEVAIETHAKVARQEQDFTNTVWTRRPGFDDESMAERAAAWLAMGCFVSLSGILILAAYRWFLT